MLGKLAGFSPETWLLPLGDAAALVVAGTLAHFIRFNPADRAAHFERLAEHPGLVVAGVVGVWGVATAAELYQKAHLLPGERFMRVGFAAVAWAALLALATYAVPSWKFGRGLLAGTTVGWGVGALAVRAWWDQMRRRREKPKVLVVGEERELQPLVALAQHPACPWDLVSVAPEKLEGELAAGEVSVVAVSDPGRWAERLVALHFSGVPVVPAAELWAFVEGRLPLAFLSPEAFLHQREFGGIHWEVFNRVTRVVDVAVSLALLVITMPLLLLASLAVLVADGRPVFYRQVRLGQFGRPFVLWKLRTMRRDAEADGPEFSAENDPRVTRLGRLLRRLRVDELPQLFNVLSGDMSLVGPRPERPEFVKKLAEEIPYYTFRLAVPPGLTGWAQVNMPYARTVEEHRKKLEYDLYFIRERSFSLYVLVLLRTVSAALFGVRS
ncbi:MAG: exopolysaccharide biosynthesis polyprenyl glycosylphosphotransferase [Thermoanaerobaculum sp.]